MAIRETRTRGGSRRVARWDEFCAEGGGAYAAGQTLTSLDLHEELRSEWLASEDVKA